MDDYADLRFAFGGTPPAPVLFRSSSSARASGEARDAETTCPISGKSEQSRAFYQPILSFWNLKKNQVRLGFPVPESTE
jgi:hypothetical protein